MDVKKIFNNFIAYLFITMICTMSFSMVVEAAPSGIPPRPVVSQPAAPPAPAPTRVLFYENKSARGYQVGSLEINKDQTNYFDFTKSNVAHDNRVCSLVIKNGKAGTYFRILDDPSGNRNNAYTEYFIKKDFDTYTINSFDLHINNDLITSIPHGKLYLSAYANAFPSGLYYNTTSNAPQAPQPTRADSNGEVSFYSRNGLSGYNLGTIQVGSDPLDFNLTSQDTPVANDRTSSVQLRDLAPGTVITLFSDASNEMYNKPYTVITVKASLPTLNIYTLNNDYEDDNSKIQRFNGGLVDGTVSRVIITPSYQDEYVKIRNVSNSQYIQAGTERYTNRLLTNSRITGDVFYWKIVRLPQGQVLLENKADGSLANLESVVHSLNNVVQVNNYGTNYLSTRFRLEYTGGHGFKIKSAWWRIRSKYGNDLDIAQSGRYGYVQGFNPDTAAHPIWRIER